MTQAYIDYHSNNSGGRFWLKDEDWKALEQAGWIVHWIHNWNDPDHEHSDQDPWQIPNHRHSYTDPLVPSTPSGEEWLNTKATSAAVTVGEGGVYSSPDAAVEAFEHLANQNVDDEGCGCCGPPHSFNYVDEKGDSHYLGSRPTGYTRSWD